MTDNEIPAFTREVTGIWQFTTAPLNGQVFVSQDEQPRCIIRDGLRFFFVTGSWEYEFLYDPDEILLVDGELLYHTHTSKTSGHISDGTPCLLVEETGETESDIGYDGQYIYPQSYVSSSCVEPSHYLTNREDRYYYGGKSIDESRWNELHSKQQNRIVHLSFGEGEFLGLLTKETIVVASLASGQCMELEPRYQNIVHVCSHIHDRIQFYILDGLRLFRVVYTPS